jgi:Flp pilus assembly protein TadG
MGGTTAYLRNRRNGKGQALVEFGIVVTLLVVLTLGAIEFGYAFLALHFVTQATAAGARAASVLEVGSRGACGQLTGNYQAAIQTLVRSQVGSVATVSSVVVEQVPQPTGSGTSTDPCGPTPNLMPKVSVTVQGSIPRIFGLLGSSPVQFTRTQTFRDEGL